MIPKKLTDILEGYDEEDYSFFLTKAGYAGNGFSLDFTLNLQTLGNAAPSSQSWQVKAIECRKCHVAFGSADFLKISQDNALLWEFTDVQSELYFTGQVREPARLFFDLYKVHKELFDDYQPFDLPFIGDRLYTEEVFFSNGFLAKGPRKLLERYAQCLQQNGLKFSIIGDRRPTIWDGFKHVAESQDLKVLFLGDTYIIAESFVFEPQDKNSR